MGEYIRYIELKKGVDASNILQRLSKGTIVRLQIGESLIDEDIRVFSNLPRDDAPFRRNEYYELPWICHSKPALYFEKYVQLNLTIAGTFRYYFTSLENTEVELGCGHLIIDPELHYASNQAPLPLDAICLQTVVTKLLGPFNEWKSRLRVSYESGYNVIHFTPIQSLGASNSAYSIKDFLAVDERYGPNMTISDVSVLVREMASEWDMMSITDIVLNHISFDSPAIHKHPEFGYNMVNSPYLIPAFVLDRIFWQLSLDIGGSLYADNGILPSITSEEDLKRIEALLLEQILPQYHFHEYFTVDIPKMTSLFKAYFNENPSITPSSHSANCAIDIIQDQSFRRLNSTIDIAAAIKHFYYTRPNLTEEELINRTCQDFHDYLVYLNDVQQTQINVYLSNATHNALANARYHFLDPAGQNFGCNVSEEHPIVWRYFTVHPYKRMTTKEEIEALKDPEICKHFKACNGWVMNDDPLRNFAARDSWVYFKRELVVWGDSVKLRYGKQPSDNPDLWDMMEKYCMETAKYFHGIRLDNLHSTPLEVSQCMVDACRRVKPDLLIVAELFTGMEDVDNIFINNLGLNCLIREAMSANNCQEMGRQIHRYGGVPVGAFFVQDQGKLQSCMSQALYMDVTHDNNPSAIERRTVHDPLPTSAVIALGCFATGSSRGYDEMVPHHINIVTEERFYAKWTDTFEETNSEFVSAESGMIQAKRLLNDLHKFLAFRGYSQIYVDQVSKDIISVTRHQPAYHQSVIVVARTAFSDSSFYDTFVPPLTVPGVVEEIIFEAKVSYKSTAFQKNDNFINGINGYSLEINQHLQLFTSSMVECSYSGEASDPQQQIDFIDFPPGSVIAFRVSLNPVAKNAIRDIRRSLKAFGFRVKTLSGGSSSPLIENVFNFSSLSLTDMTRVLFHCHEEEVSDGRGFGAYYVPGYGALPYCGLAGFSKVFDDIRYSNNLGHPICNNLRDGNWMMDYIHNRLQINHRTKEIGRWFYGILIDIQKLPRYLIPTYFDVLIRYVYDGLVTECFRKMSDSELVKSGSEFARMLSLTSVQLLSHCRTATLPSLDVEMSNIPYSVDCDTGKKIQCCASLAAGFPHFSHGIMRNWGRDTFISIRGLLLLTSRYEEAKHLILSYAATLRHGLIPNLLGEGIAARFNCRDAVWWWLKAIKDYCELCPDGESILKENVLRMYPTDTAEPVRTPSKMQLSKVMQEALMRHFNGIKFREINAGHLIDAQMSEQGFDMEIGIDKTTGFVFGGNRWNCGTWMDKMGESGLAGNKGHPATPRNGSAVELVALSAAIVKWLYYLCEKGVFPYRGVQAGNIKWTYKKWYKEIKANFEKYFYIDDEPNDTNNIELVHKHNIYKDSVGATLPGADYQLRPNFCIAITVCPDLITPEKAWKALCIVEKKLAAPLGIKTLDPDDWVHRGNYDGGIESNDYQTSKGFNYHNGPEWLWIANYFLCAKLTVANLSGDKDKLVDAIKTCKHHLARQFFHLKRSSWMGLPELTNANGTHCNSSCNTQAWSSGCALEALDCLVKIYN